MRGRVRGYAVKRLRTKALPYPEGLRKPLTLPPLAAAGPTLSLWERDQFGAASPLIVTLPIPAPARPPQRSGRVLKPLEASLL